MIEHLRVLYQYRDLLLLWTLREVKVRYKQSVLGAAWAILQPLALMLVFTVIFSFIGQFPSDGVPYPLFSYTALLAWTFFASALSFGIPTLINNLNLVTKVYFPREILPIASVGAAFVDFLVAGLLCAALVLWYGTPVTWTLLWVPVLGLIQILLILGIVLPMSALNVFYRDIRFVVPLAIQLWLYATPVIYPVSVVPDAWRSLYALNPMVGIVDSYRRVLLLAENPAPAYLALSAIASITLACAGYIYFKRAEDNFADLI